MSTTMQRLQAWLMPAFGCFTLSVAAIGLRVNTATPHEWFWTVEAVACVLLGIGGLLMIVGTLKEVTIPFFVWWLGSRGKLYRALKRRIKEGHELGSQAILSTHQEEWAMGVRVTLMKYAGGWSPDIEDLKKAGDPNRTPYGKLMPKAVLARQIRIVERLVTKLAHGES